MTEIILKCQKHGLDCDSSLMCPKCHEVGEKDLCAICEEHRATVNFSEGGVLAYTHGFYERMCQCCYVKKIETELVNITNNLQKQRDILAEKGCL